MLKKVLAAVLAICMMFAALTACGIKKKDDGAGIAASGPKKNSSEKDAAAAKKEIDDALDTLEEAGVELDDDLQEMLENIDEADIEAAQAARATDVKISVDAPEGWTVENNDYANYSAVNGMRTFMVMCSEEPSGVGDIAAYAKNNQDKMKTVFSEAEYSDITSVNIDGTKGGRFHIDLEIFGLKQRQIYVYYCKDGLVTVVQGCYIMGMGDDEAESEAEINKMIDSVRVEKR